MIAISAALGVSNSTLVISQPITAHTFQVSTTPSQQLSDDGSGGSAGLSIGVGVGVLIGASFAMVVGLLWLRRGKRNLYTMDPGKKRLDRISMVRHDNSLLMIEQKGVADYL